jgi:demethylmenaquinone methyltransferase/2-methoxy-6-polyprenyl-1,4-benzoquinol methylase
MAPLRVRKMRFSAFHLLDVATGTVDLAIEAAEGTGIRVTRSTSSQDVTQTGKVARTGPDGSGFSGGRPGASFPDGSFDAVGIAFGIRNMPDRLGALREMRRVLVPGGRIFVLEMNAPRNRLWRGFFVPYLNRILPVIASRFSRNPAAYLYLVDSITHFLLRRLLAMMKQAGFPAIERYS